MPTKALTICHQPGCGKATPGRYCAAHRQANVEQTSTRDRERRRRQDGSRTLYDSSWWRELVRPRILARDPMCKIGVLCGGNAPSTEVDHMVAIEDGGTESDGNLQGACKPDHTRKTALEQVARRRSFAVAAAIPDPSGDPTSLEG